MTKKEDTQKENPFVAYFVGAFEEFNKVTWPTKEQAVLLTAVTVVVSLALAGLLALLDLGLSEVYQGLLSLFI